MEATSWSESERAMFRDLREDLTLHAREYFALVDHDRDRITDHEIDQMVTERLRENLSCWMDERISAALGAPSILGVISPDDPEAEDEEDAL